MTEIFRLPNGVTCVLENRAGTGSVNMEVSIKNGSSGEAPDEKGLTWLTQEAMDRGTATRSRDDIIGAIEGRGGAYGSESTFDLTYFEAMCLARDASDVFEILADVIRNPQFDAAEVKKVQDQVATTIDQRKQKPSAEMIDNYFTDVLGDAGRSALGDDTALVKSFTPSQLKKRHDELLSDPDKIVVSFVGDIDRATVEALAKKHFGDLKKTAQPQTPAPITFKGGDSRVDADNDQLNIIFGFEAPSRHGEDRYAYELLSQILSGGMSSPLFQEVREKRGLVYGVGSTYKSFEDTGTFVIQAGTGKGQARELISVSLDVMGDIAKNGVTQEQIDTARERIIRSAKAKFESADLVTGFNAEQLLKFGRLRTTEEVEAQLKKVKPEHIRKACYEMLANAKFSLSCVGPQDNMPDAAEIRQMRDKQVRGVTPPKAKPLDNSAVAGQFNATAQSQRSKPVVKMTTLPNGLRIVTEERPGSVAAGAWVDVGSDHETPELNGATHMNEHMMFKGTPSFKPGEIDKIVEQELGGGLNAFTSKDKTAYYFYNLLPEHLDKVAHICGDMVFFANIDEEEYDGKTETQPDGTTVKRKGERDVVVEEIKMYSDDPYTPMDDLLNTLCYPNQPHGRPILGTEKVLRATSSADLRKYRDEFYTPDNVVFVATGPIKHEDFVDIVKKRYGNLKKGAAPKPLPQQSYKGGTDHVEARNTTRNLFALAMPAAKAGDKDYYAWRALATILGGGRSSRLQKRIVDDKALAPDIGAGAIAYPNVGQFSISAAVDPADTREVLKEIYAEIRDLQSTLGQGELDRAKARIEMGLLNSTETNMSACTKHGGSALAHGKPFDAEEEVRALSQVTLADVKRVAATLLAVNPTLAMAVPQGTDKSLLPDHKEHLAIRDAAGAKGPAAKPSPHKKAAK